jgi:hypothetical protein
MGIVLTAIVSGVVLGALLRLGMAEKSALEIAIPMGFLFAIGFWLSIARSFSGKRRPQITGPISASTLNIEGQQTFAYSCQLTGQPTITSHTPGAV